MKIKLLIVFGLYSVLGVGQVINMELPTLSPQSPTTGDLGKYGEIQVNESTGKISPSIPLFEYNAGEINIPITLQYSGNGVRVNQDPTWTGINWNLSPGGVITRVVKDKVDELTSTVNRRYFSETELNNLPGVRQPLNSTTLDPNTVWYQTINELSDAAVDTEADIFNYSFLGYSGSFYLDQNNQVHLIKYDKELSITFSFMAGNKSGFLIKTPEGDSYFFGYNASESSKTWLNIGTGSTAGIVHAQNAFYLYQISFLNGGAVTFEYESFDTTCSTTKIGIQECMSKSSTSACTKTTRTLYSDVEKLVRLKKITSTFNDQYVDFEVTTYGECSRMRKLNTVSLKNGNHQVLKKINLIYTTIYKEIIPEENKFFLDKVEFYNRDDQFVYDYELTYNSPAGLPSKDSFSQDDLGYYNGKTNTTLLPKTTNSMLNNSCYSLADREANLYYAGMGSLFRIKYPTGGYSEFEYELPFKEQQQVYSSHYMTAYYSDPSRSKDSSSHLYNSSTGYHTYSMNYLPDGGEDGITIISPTSITIDLSISALGSFSSQNNVLISVIRMSDNSVVWTNSATGNNGPFGYPLGTTNNELKSYATSYTFLLQPGKYFFKISVNMSQSVCPCQTPTQNHPIDNDNYVVANAQLYLPASLRDVYNPGLRIKRIKSFDVISATPTITRYYYNSRNNILGHESFQFFPNYINVTRGHNSGDPETAPLTDFFNLNTNSVKNSFNMDEQVYPYVTVSYGGDLFENGGKEMNFENHSNYPPRYYITSVIPWNTDEYNFSSYVDVSTNDSYENSMLKEEIHFDSNKTPVKKVKYNYNGTVDNVVNNIKMYIMDPGSVFNLSKVHLLYQTKSFKYRLTSTETWDYFGSPTNYRITTSTNSYDADKVSLPKSIVTTYSNSGDSKKTNIYYPSDIAAIGNLTSDDLTNIPLLVNKHNLSEVIKTESFVNNELVDTKQVSFKNFGLNNILPSTIRERKGSNVSDPIEDRIVFHSYSYEKPTLVSLKDGSKTEYIYNNNQQVLLKIENFDTSFIIDDGLNMSDPCYYQTLYPTCMVTKYNYDPVTNNLISIIDPKCNKITYSYDAFGRLESVKDQDNNIITENKYNYRP